MTTPKDLAVRTDTGVSTYSAALTRYSSSTLEPMALPPDASNTNFAELQCEPKDNHVPHHCISAEAQALPLASLACLKTNARSKAQPQLFVPVSKATAAKTKTTPAVDSASAESHALSAVSSQTVMAKGATAGRSAVPSASGTVAAATSLPDVKKIATASKSPSVLEPRAKTATATQPAPNSPLVSVQSAALSSTPVNTATQARTAPVFASTLEVDKPLTAAKPHASKPRSAIVTEATCQSLTTRFERHTLFKQHQQEILKIFTPFAKPLPELSPQLGNTISLQNVMRDRYKIFAKKNLPQPDSQMESRVQAWIDLDRAGYLHAFDYDYMGPAKTEANATEGSGTTCTPSLAGSTAISTDTQHAVKTSEPSGLAALAQNRPCNQANCEQREPLFNQEMQSFQPYRYFYGFISPAILALLHEGYQYLDYCGTSQKISYKGQEIGLIRKPKALSELKSNFVFLRKRLGISQQELSLILFCRQCMIANWESPFNQQWFPDHLLPFMTEIFFCHPTFLDRRNYDFYMLNQEKIVVSRSNNGKPISLTCKPIRSTNLVNNLSFLMCYRNMSWADLCAATGFSGEMLLRWRDDPIMQMDQAICWRLASVLRCPMQFLTFNQWKRKMSLRFFDVEQHPISQLISNNRIHNRNYPPRMIVTNSL